MMPQRYDAFNMGLSQLSPGFRNSGMMSHHTMDADASAHTYDFNRMQQHLSDGPSFGYRSNLQNIQENEHDENVEDPSSPEISPQHRNTGSITTAMTGSVIRRASHREGPMNSSHERSLFHSLYGQAGAYEPMSSDLTTADMCLSECIKWMNNILETKLVSSNKIMFSFFNLICVGTLYLHELYHRQSRRRTGTSARMPPPSYQQNIWQLPHRESSSAQMQNPASQSNTSPHSDSNIRPAAEKTPLLQPKNT